MAKTSLKPDKLKVLTFGWEFPPHITGGLGTACYGLTKALLERGTDILFVVPKAHGDEELEMINASDVLIREMSAAPVKMPLPLTAGRSEIRIIPVPAEIRPYTSVEGNPSSGLEEWNYVMEESKTASGKRQVSPPIGKQYKFSGAYGPFLLEEVSRYGEVGGAVAGQHEFDLIHAHDWLTFPAGIAAKKASKKPLIVHVHATEYDRARSQYVDTRVLAIEKKGMEEADHVVAVSEWTKNTLVSKYGISREKITVVYNGVIRLKKKSPVPSPSKLGTHMVTFLGRVTHQKGPHYFIEAARRVLEKFPDTHFVVGGSGDLLPSIMERVAALRLSSRFHFTGFLKAHQVDQVWTVTDVYVMPSVSEPFGIAPLEAIRAGVPVILSKQSGVSEVMPHAIKADFWDTEALAGAICSVLQHKSLAETLRTEGKQSLKDISWNNAARKLNKLYHEVYKRK